MQPIRCPSFLLRLVCETSLADHSYMQVQTFLGRGQTSVRRAVTLSLHIRCPHACCRCRRRPPIPREPLYRNPATLHSRDGDRTAHSNLNTHTPKKKKKKKRAAFSVPTSCLDRRLNIMCWPCTTKKASVSPPLNEAREQASLRVRPAIAVKV